MSFTTSKSAAPLSSIPRGWVTIAAVCLALAALAGTALGVVRSLGAHDVPSDAGELAPVPNTTQAKALPTDSLDEGRIRSIAREEAQAALTRSAPRPKAAPKADPDSSDDPTDLAPPTTTLAAPKTPTITPIRPTVSVTAPSSSSRTPTTSNPYPPGLTPN